MPDGSYARASQLVADSGSETFDYIGFGSPVFGDFADRGLVPAETHWRAAMPVADMPESVPDDLVPALLISPRGARMWQPLDSGEETTAKWRSRVNRIIDEYRDGHTVVLVDAHC